MVVAACHVATVFQNDAPHAHLSVRDNLATSMRIRRVARPGREWRVPDGYESSRDVGKLLNPSPRFEADGPPSPIEPSRPGSL